MQVVNLLTFLNSIQDISSLSFAKCDYELINLLDLGKIDSQFTQNIDLGIVYVSQKTLDKYVIVDGLSRILSLSLLLHAICECYKKTTDKNEKAIKTIRKNYLINKSRTKLRLTGVDDDLYNKIINGERLSGHEKLRPIFLLLHKYWTTIKEEKLQASNILRMLQKIQITIVETSDVPQRDLYISINKQNRELNQLDLIDDFFCEKKLDKVWQSIKSLYFLDNQDAILFLKDFFITKFDYKYFDNSCLYDSLKNYFETMVIYQNKNILMDKIKLSAMLYSNILNVNFDSKDIKTAFINIKKHSGEDTYAYILNVYEDYYLNNITESTFIEILDTIDEYLKNRMNSGKNIDFNELIQYLNAFITCK